MADTQHSPTDTREQAVQIKEAWTNMGSTVTYGGMTLTELETTIARLDSLASSIAQLEDRLTSARNEYQSTRYALWNLVKRARAGAKANYGDDSDEYQRFGGTRISDRARRRSTKLAPAPVEL